MEFGCDDPEHSYAWLKTQIHYLIGERMEIYWAHLFKVEAAIEEALHTASDLRSTASRALENAVRTASTSYHATLSLMIIGTQRTLPKD